MFEELEKGLVLRDLVSEILRPGPRSISQVGAALRERGLRLHRLAVAGYLKALADSGFLVEQEIPPAKTYALKPGAARRNLYQSVGDACRAAAATATPADRLLLQVLWDLFRRPIFHEEFRRAGLDPPTGAADVGGEERQAARRFLSRSPLKLPFNDPAYRPAYKDALVETPLKDASRAILASLVRDEFHAAGLAVTTKQSTLGGAD